MAASAQPIGRIYRLGDLWLVGGLLGTVVLLVLPIPPILLDLLLTVSIALSLLTLLVILYLREPSDFTGFPSLLLFITLFRLALNVASTRLILLDGYAGHIIEAFGNFVVRGNYVVGLVVFLILVLINFIVITKGAGRIAEVAARFTLDALPGKQMAIDAELNAGLIKEDEARARRRQLEQESDFYGAMDGASKFVRGDAIAAILITAINIVGGFAIGILQKGMTVTESLQRFTLLSVGDGLVSQIPALITSTAAGILVTRAASRTSLGQDLTHQLFLFPRAVTALAVMLFVLALVPGLPMFPFLILGTGAALLARALHRQTRPATAASPAATTQGGESSGAGTTAATPSAVTSASGTEKLESLLHVDPLQIELGYGLIGLADTRKGGDLLERITGVRRHFAAEMGLLIPPIRIRDNLQLGANEYRFLVKGEVVARGELRPGRWLAMNVSNSSTTIPGEATKEPVFQLPAVWIAEPVRHQAELAGYTVVDAASVLVTHLSETIKRHAHEILSRQDVQTLLDHLKQTHPTVVNELVPAQLTVGQVQRILQNLLAEGVSIRNLALILERVSDYAAVTKNPDELSEHARRALAAQIARPFQQPNGAVRAITLDPKLEQELARGLRQSPTEVALVMEPKLARHLTEWLSRLVGQMVSAGQPPVLLCAPQLRLGLRRFFESTLSELAVLSYAELPARVTIEPAAMIPCPETS
ncbi:MAG: flagellar biosynthesis protein FlhA [Verrucomicrobiae bacterium]|nr:flagellar biosynthesis protein FlhA [Verrucomicrobiae bacterium]MDW8343569.1 flagellar biosynthesis protein FlhA [Verrucomicrobiae bacterium]